PKVKMRRLELRAEDVEVMISLMARRGVTGTEKEVFQALVEAFAADEVRVQQRQVQTVQELTTSLSWFTNRIDALEKSCEQLQQERDRLQIQQSTTEELRQLKDENARLRRELQQTQSRLEGIQKLLGGGGENGSITTPVEAPVAPVAPVAPRSQAQTPTTTRRDRAETDAKLNQIIDALISWNTSQENPDSQLRISIPAIKGLASAMGASYQPAIQKVLQERAQELEELHSRLMLGTRHNAGVFKKDEILRVIARDYLGLENWQEVRYVG
ncbi:MAG: hypothetical protein SNJ57_13020, partial [Cyanobacteriota bacterium]